MTDPSHDLLRFSDAGPGSPEAEPDPPPPWRLRIAVGLVSGLLAVAAVAARVWPHPRPEGEAPAPGEAIVDVPEPRRPAPVVGEDVASPDEPAPPAVITVWPTTDGAVRRIEPEAVARAEPEPRPASEPEPEPEPEPEGSDLADAYRRASPAARLAIVELDRPVRDEDPVVDRYQSLLEKARRLYADAPAEVAEAVAAAAVILRKEGLDGTPREILDAMTFLEPPAPRGGGLRPFQPWLDTYMDLRRPGRTHTQAVALLPQAYAAARAGGAAGVARPPESPGPGPEVAQPPGPFGPTYRGFAAQDILILLPKDTPLAYGETPGGVSWRRGSPVQLRRVRTHEGELKWLIRSSDGEMALVGDEFVRARIRRAR